MSVAAGRMQGFEALYFSFVTLTTVGYGDILPVAPCCAHAGHDGGHDRHPYLTGPRLAGWLPPRLRRRHPPTPSDPPANRGEFPEPKFNGNHGTDL